MCWHTVTMHLRCHHKIIRDIQCDEATSPFSLVFCPAYNLAKFSSDTKCFGQHCRLERPIVWWEHVSPRIHKLSSDLEDLNILMGTRQAECKIALHGIANGGPVQQQRDQELFLRLKQDLSDMLIQRSNLEQEISSLRERYKVFIGTNEEAVDSIEPSTVRHDPGIVFTPVQGLRTTGAAIRNTPVFFTPQSLNRDAAPIQEEESPLQPYTNTFPSSRTPKAKEYSTPKSRHEAYPTSKQSKRPAGRPTKINAAQPSTLTKRGRKKRLSTAKATTRKPVSRTQQMSDDELTESTPRIATAEFMWSPSSTRRSSRLVTKQSEPLSSPSSTRRSSRLVTKQRVTYAESSEEEPIRPTSHMAQPLPESPQYYDDSPIQNLADFEADADHEDDHLTFGDMVDEDYELMAEAMNQGHGVGDHMDMSVTPNTAGFEHFIDPGFFYQ